jgi:hypothetical protein
MSPSQLPLNQIPRVPYNTIWHEEEDGEEGIAVEKDNGPS